VVLLAAVSLAIIVASFAARFGILTTRRFDPDELEHAHVAWEISQGAVPYRDFFEMHPPLVDALMTPVVRHFDTTTADGGFAALFTLRRLAWCVSLLVVLATFELARQVDGLRTALIAAALLSTDIVLAHRGMEIRPDGVATLSWLVCLVLMRYAMTGDPRSSWTRIRFAGSGLAIGLAVLASQKVLLAGPALMALLSWYVISPRFGATTKARVLAASAQVVGCVMPWVIAIAYFAVRHGAGAFFHAVLFQDLAWRSEASSVSVLRYIAHYDPWMFGLAGAGACLIMVEAVRQPARRPSNLLMAATSGTMFAGLFFIPVPFPQYCLTFLPLFAVLGGMFLTRVSSRLEARATWSGWWLAATILLGILGVVGLIAASPVVRSPWIYPAVVAAGVGGLVSVRWHRQSGLGLVVVLLALSLYPAQWTTWIRGEGDGGQFAELRFIQSTRANAVVLDGWSGLGVFRQHAWYYWMLHPGVQAMLSRESVSRLESDILSGGVRPDVVVLDAQLRALSEPISRYVQLHYRDSGLDDIYLSR